MCRLARAAEGAVDMSFVPLIDRNGNAFDNFILGSSVAGSTSERMAGLEGDDFLLGDSGNVRPFFAGASSFATAYNIDDASFWSTDENPLIEDGNTPYTSLYLRGTQAESLYVAVTVGGGQSITIDIDFGAHSIGSPVFVDADIYDGSQTLVQEAQGRIHPDVGSTSSSDDLTEFTAPSAGTYFIHFHRSGLEPSFQGGETYVAHISVTGHAIGLPIAMGADILAGDGGDDFLIGQAGGDDLRGGIGGDSLYGGSDDDLLSGGDGDDLIVGGIGGDTISGGRGFDEADYSSSVSAVAVDLGTGSGSFADAQGDQLTGIENLTGSAFADALTGDGRANVLDGGDGDDLLDGGGGNDRVTNGVGSDTMIGGAGIDTADYSRNSFSVSIDLQAGTADEAFGNGDTLSGFEVVIGTGGGDTLMGSVGNDRLIGLTGIGDTIDGRGGDDYIEASGQGGTINGGVGFDRLSFRDAFEPLSIDFSTRTFTHPWGYVGTFGGIDYLEGSSFGDQIAGSLWLDRIAAGDGDDRIDAREGDDQLAGGDGDDRVIGGAGNDAAAGDEGDDWLSAGSGNDQLNGGLGADTVEGGSGNDILDGGTGGDLLAGGSGNDIYRVDSIGDEVRERADNGLDRLFARTSYVLAEGVAIENLNSFSAIVSTPIDLAGNSFANRIGGNAGANILSGGGGDDLLTGLGGNDRLRGGAGRDALNGGAGRDGFDFDTAPTAVGDLISDFAPADDSIYLDRRVFGAIAADGAIAASAFRAGTAAADAGDRIIYDSGSGRIYYDADGAGGAAQSLFALVDPGTAVTRLDFIAYSGASEARGFAKHHAAAVIARTPEFLPDGWGAAHIV